MIARPRVFVLMTTDKDVRQAEAYGDVEYVYSRGEPRASMWDDALYEEALDRLVDRGYDPGADYVLLAGPVVAVVLFAAAVTSAYHRPQALCYDIQQSRYVPKLLGRRLYEPEADAAVQDGPGAAR